MADETEGEAAVSTACEHNASEGVHGNGSGEQAGEGKSAVLGGHNGKQSASIPGGYGRGAIIPIRTTERAREVAAIRWSRYRQSAAAEVARAVAAVADADDGERIRASKRGDVAAYGAIAGKLAERAYVDADPQAARFVRDAIGANVGAPDTRQHQPGGHAPAVSISLSADAARALAGVLAALSGSDNSNYSNQSDNGDAVDADAVRVLPASETGEGAGAGAGQQRAAKRKSE